MSSKIFKSSTFRKIESKAEKGDLKALYQLYSIVGESNDADEMASKYLNRALSKLDDFHFQFERLQLIDFRRFEFLEVSFDRTKNSNLTVLVGINGAGKSAVLDGVAKCLSWFVRRIVSSSKGDGNGEHISSEDIRVDSQYASVIGRFSISRDAQQYSVDLTKSVEGSASSRKSDFEDVNFITDLIRRRLSRDPSFQLPLVVYYGVDRATEISTKDFQLKNTDYDVDFHRRFEAYDSFIKGASDFKNFVIWFSMLEVEQGLSGSRDKNKKDVLFEKLYDLSVRVKSNYSDKYIMTEFQRLLSELPNEEDGEPFDKVRVYPARKTVKIIRSVVEAFMPGAKNIRVTRTPKLDVLIDKEGVTLSLRQLSQGEKSMLALVTDLARRQIILNPTLKNPLLGHGIVLIDELDLHLHPSWQQSVLGKLTSIFPNIQFIVSTHSPLILSTIPMECIRVLSNDKDGSSIAVRPNFHTYGVPSGDVLEGVMAVPSQPPIKERSMLSELTELVDQGVCDTERVKELLFTLKNKLGDAHPQIKKIERTMRIVAGGKIAKDIKNSK